MSGKGGLLVVEIFETCKRTVTRLKLWLPRGDWGGEWSMVTKFVYNSDIHFTSHFVFKSIIILEAQRRNQKENSHRE